MKNRKILLFALLFLPFLSAAAEAADFVDHHMHVWSQALSLLWPALEEPDPVFVDGEAYYKPEDGTAAQLVEALDHAGFARGATLSGGYFWGSPWLPTDDLERRVRNENNYAAAQCLLYSDRTIFLASVNPLLDFASREVDRCAKMLGAKGLKLHFNVARLDVTNEEHMKRLGAVLATAAANNLPVLIHYRSTVGMPYTPETFIVFLDRTIGEIPNLVIQFAHGVGTGGFDELNADILRTLTDYCLRNPDAGKRVWMDISGSILDDSMAEMYKGIAGGGIMHRTTPEEVQKLRNRLREFGLDRVLFASDFGGGATLQPKPHLKLIRDELGLTEEELLQIATNPGPW